MIRAQRANLCSDNIGGSDRHREKLLAVRIADLHSPAAPFTLGPQFEVERDELGDLAGVVQGSNNHVPGSHIPKFDTHQIEKISLQYGIPPSCWGSNSMTSGLAVELTSSIELKQKAAYSR